jgi:hypothetical protein
LGKRYKLPVNPRYVKRGGFRAVALSRLIDAIAWQCGWMWGAFAVIAIDAIAWQRGVDVGRAAPTPPD